jgi:hypothetical protein
MPHSSRFWLEARSSPILNQWPTQARSWLEWRTTED